MRYECSYHVDGYTEERAAITGATRQAVRAEAREGLEAWVREGDWGVEGALVIAHVTLTSPDGEEETVDLEVEVEPDHDALMRAAGADSDCDHEWIATAEVEGGCDANPGVWSLGGTALQFTSHCAACGLRRREVSHGSQRNPGESDVVEYSLPGADWAAEEEEEREE